MSLKNQETFGSLIRQREPSRLWYPAALLGSEYRDVTILREDSGFHFNFEHLDIIGWLSDDQLDYIARYVDGDIEREDIPNDLPNAHEIELLLDGPGYSVEPVENYGDAQHAVLMQMMVDLAEKVDNVDGVVKRTESTIASVREDISQCGGGIGSLQQWTTGNNESMGQLASNLLSVLKGLEAVQVNGRDLEDRLSSNSRSIEQIQKSLESVRSCVQNVPDEIAKQEVFRQQSRTSDEEFAEKLDDLCASDGALQAVVVSSLESVQRSTMQIGEWFLQSKEELEALSRVLNGGMKTWVEQAIQIADESTSLLTALSKFVDMGGFDSLSVIREVVETLNCANSDLQDRITNAAVLINTIRRDLDLFSETADRAAAVDAKIDATIEQIRARNGVAAATDIANSLSAAILAGTAVAKLNKKENSL